MVVLGLLPEDLRNSILDKDPNCDSDTNKSLFLIIAGIVYASMPASLLWRRRKRYPKVLDIGDEP